MRWQNLQTEQDVTELMCLINHFHDWDIAGFRYDPYAHLSDSYKFGWCPCASNSLSLAMRSDVVERDGSRLEVIIEFIGINSMRFWPKEVGSLDECHFQKTKSGWVFAIDSPLSEEELENPMACCSTSFIEAGKARWRIHVANGNQTSPAGNAGK